MPHKKIHSSNEKAKLKKAKTRKAKLKKAKTRKAKLKKTKTKQRINLDQLAGLTLLISSTVTSLSKGQQKTLGKIIKQKRTKMKKKDKSGNKRIRGGRINRFERRSKGEIEEMKEEAEEARREHLEEAFEEAEEAYIDHLEEVELEEMKEEAEEAYRDHLEALEDD